jgi:hypothetical protein
MQPNLQHIIQQSPSSSVEYTMAKQFLELSSTIFWGSLALHIVFGGVMGFCARLAVAETSIIHD